MRWFRWFPQEREDACSEETWNGGDGRIDFNYVQQSVPEPDPGECPNMVTDPWGIADDVYRG